MRTNFIFSLALTATLGACSSTPTPPVTSRPQQERLRTVQLTPEDSRRVRTGETVKTYHLGRSPSGRNGGTMHEAHRVYRIEKPNRWNLARNQPPFASTGPTSGLTDPAFRPAPDSQAIRTELDRQEQITTELADSRDALIDTLGSARARLQGSVNNVTLTTSLKTEIARLRQENQKLRSSFPPSSKPPEDDSESPTEILREWGQTLDSKSP